MATYEVVLERVTVERQTVVLKAKSVKDLEGVVAEYMSGDVSDVDGDDYDDYEGWEADCGINFPEVKIVEVQKVKKTA